MFEVNLIACSLLLAFNNLIVFITLIETSVDKSSWLNLAVEA